MFPQLCAAVAIFADKTCPANCGLQCNGYGQLPNDACPTGVKPPCCGVCNNAGSISTNFVTWTPSSKSRAGCHKNKECLVCPDNQNETIAVHRGFTVYLSQECTHYVPSDTAVATLAVQAGANDITLVGPGSVRSAVWPLTPGQRFSVMNGLAFTLAPEQLSASTKPQTAVHIAENGDLSVDAVAPNFTALVTISSPRATPIHIKQARVRGHADEVVLALAHVSGDIAVECTKANQSLIVQESQHDSLALSFWEDSECTSKDEINLASMLGAYGQQYDILFYEGKVPKKFTSVWKEAEYVWFVAGTLFLAIALSHQKQIYEFVTKW